MTPQPQPTHQPFYQWTALALADAIRQRHVQARDVVAATFEQIDRHNDSLKAFITLCRDQAKTEAEAVDAALDRGEQLGRLAGVPFSAKDLTPTARVRTTQGSLIYQDAVPDQDELCIARLKQAGAILIGKTNTPEFGLGAHTNNPLYGPTSTPYNLSYSSGGSSGGAAAAVATGMCALAQGTDLGGSVRTPASFCGVVGLRPSAGRIPRPRKALLWDYLDTDGVLARTIEDAALMLSVMAGWDSRDPVTIAQTHWPMPRLTMLADSQPCPTRVGVSADLGIAMIDAEVRAVFEEAIAQIASICPHVEPAYPDCSMARPAFETLRAALLWHKQQHHYQHHADQLTDTVRWNVARGKDISAAEFLTASAQRDQLYRNFLDFFDTYDVLATVSACVPPFPHHQTDVLEVNGTPLRHRIDYLAITYTISLTGLPALSMPCGYTATGLPIGLQLVGKPQGEAALLQFAYTLQEQLSWRHRWPDLTGATATDL